MKSKYYIKTVLFLGLCFTLFFSSCSDDSTDSKEIENDDNEEGLASNVDILTEDIVSNICKFDSIEGAEVLTPIYGKALNAVTPTSLSCAMEDQATAYDFFCNTLINAGDEASEFLSGDESYTICDLGENGTVSYRKSNQPGELAVITYNIPRLKNVISTLTIIQTQAWPENDISSKFGLGDILREKVDGQNRYWVCVREFGGGFDGIILTVDYGWRTENLSDHYKSYTAYYNVAGLDAWNALSAFWYNSNSKFRMELAALQTLKSQGQDLGWVLDIFTRTIDGSNGKNVEYQYEDTWNNKYYWAAKVRNVWESRSKYVRLGKRDGWSSRFQTSDYYFKRNYSPTVPNNRNSHSRYFGYEYDERGNYLQKHYEIIYPQY